MNVLLAALNAKYIHSSLAVRSLQAYCSKAASITVRDFSINDELNNIIADIFRIKPAVIGFSSYVWNIEQIIKIAGTLKVILPETKIILGGPEVSFSAFDYLSKYSFLDAIIIGEGEKTLLEYLKAFKNNLQYDDILGLAFWKNNEVIINKERMLLEELAEIPFVYNATDFEALKNKIVYYESSRGCAFNCSYCLSSTIKGIRFLGAERIASDLKKFITADVKQVKFVDRTFNASKEHAMKVWQIIFENYNGKTNFHFEISADLLDAEMISFLASFPKGALQFEIGVQSTNPHTLEVINRKSDIKKLCNNVSMLRQSANIHIHLDLIAGLPCEDIDSFEKSFNNVFELNPHHFQLGFLKLLKGTSMNERVQEFGILSRQYPPYEVINTNWLSFEEILLLKDIEDILENYYNTGHFTNYFKYVFSKWKKGVFAYFKALAQFLAKFENKQSSYLTKIKYLADFAGQLWADEAILQKEILLFDMLGNQKRISFPDEFNFNEILVKNMTANILKDKEFIEKYLPQHLEKQWRDIIRNIIIMNCSREAANIIFETQQSGIVIHDYTNIDKISGRVKAIYISRS